MAEVMLDRSSVLAVIGQLIAAGMPKPVAVNKEAKPGSLGNAARRMAGCTARSGAV